MTHIISLNLYPRCFARNLEKPVRCGEGCEKTAVATLGREGSALPDVRQACKAPLPRGWRRQNCRRKDPDVATVRSERRCSGSGGDSTHSGLGGAEQDYLGTAAFRVARS